MCILGVRPLAALALLLPDILFTVKRSIYIERKRMRIFSSLSLLNVNIKLNSGGNVTFAFQKFCLRTNITELQRLIHVVGMRSFPLIFCLRS